MNSVLSLLMVFIISGVALFFLCLLSTASPADRLTNNVISTEKRRSALAKFLVTRKVVEIQPSYTELRVHGLESQYSSYILKLAGSQQFMLLSPPEASNATKETSNKNSDNRHINNNNNCNYSNDGNNSNSARSQSPPCIASINSESLTLGSNNVEDNDDIGTPPSSPSSSASPPFSQRNPKMNGIMKTLVRSSRNRNKEKDASTSANTVHLFPLHHEHFFLFSRCSICLMDYDGGNMLCWSKNPACSHVFHKDCILTWLMRSKICPCCRKDYVYKVKRNQGTDSSALASMAMAVEPAATSFTTTTRQQSDNDNNV
uniref:RING-type domain-containing protein n=1 Tax=Ditylum brightwellii TaxID=49249 RepID=A0A7S4QQ41_9STRA